jgi:hypothetical protein
VSASVSVPATAIVVLVAGVAAALYVWKKGGVAQAASSIGAAAVNVAGAAASGAVGAIGSSVGLPTPDQTTTDPKVARYLVDRAGWLFASKWSSAGALFTAASMNVGSGTPPPAGGPIAAALPALTTGDFTRTDHDTSPADPAAAFAQATSDAWPDLQGFGSITGPM